VPDVLFFALWYSPFVLGIITLFVIGEGPKMQVDFAEKEL
jgi:hypothetical protein